MTKIRKRRIGAVIAAAVFLLTFGLWIGGTIPRQVGKVAAINYVQKNYGEMGLTFDKMEFSSAHGDYFAVFKDRDGAVYNFLMTLKLWPTTVIYDPINPPGP